MKNSKRIVIVGLIAALTLFGFFVRRKVVESTLCPQRQNTIVFWNNTDKPMSVEFKFCYLKSKYVELDKGVRACISLVSDQTFQSWDSLRYIFVGYEDKKYKFVKEDCLNACFAKGNCPRTTRYFMVANLSVNDAVWDQVNKKFIEKDKMLNENSRYLVLSNYGKEQSAWGREARIQALATKTYKS